MVLLDNKAAFSLNALRCCGVDDLGSSNRCECRLRVVVEGICVLK